MYIKIYKEILGIKIQPRPLGRFSYLN